MKSSDRPLIQTLTLVALFLMLATPRCWSAQPYQPVQPDPVLEPWRWRSFPELKGLGLQCLAEDREGNMWFGVYDGVVRYDGINWTAYTEADGLYGSPVEVLCTARDGSVYAGTKLGISRFQDGIWRRVSPPEGELTWHVKDLMEASDGSLWAGTVWGALRLGREEETLYTTEALGAALRVVAPRLSFVTVPDGVAPIHALAESTGVRRLARWYWRAISEPGVVYALAPGGPGEAAGLQVGDRILDVEGLSEDRLLNASVRLKVEREGQTFEVVVTRPREEGTVRNFWVSDVYEDREGALWFGLCTGEILRWNRSAGSGPGDAASWRLYTEADGLDIGYWPHIVQTRDGTVWTASPHGFTGVNRFDGTVWTPNRFNTVQGTDQNHAILEAQDGTLWVAGNGGRLHTFRHGRWHTYHAPEAPIPTFKTRILEASDGALWVAGLGQEAVRLDLGASRWTTYEGLNFQCETADGTIWFVSRDSGAVRYDGQRWTRYGVDDGLIDTPRRLIATRAGFLWAAGSHGRTAATARFDGKRWSFQTHPGLGRSVSSGAVYEASDGALWFGASGSIDVGGALRFDGVTWTHHTPPEAPQQVTSIGQTPDGAVWFGGWIIVGLRVFDGRNWMRITEPEELTQTWISAVSSTSGGDLWVGTRTFGLFRYDGRAWTRYDVQDGLADTWVRDILQTDDGSLWVSTGEGISRFDGRTWITHVLPPGLMGELNQSRDGALWININRWFVQGGSLIPVRRAGRTIRYLPDTHPPETEMTLSLDEVSQPGNTPLAWKGADPWRETPDGQLQYSYRLNGGEWSPFSKKTSDVFLALPGGDHTFEVKARDRNFNEDPNPAVAHFTVVPPIWKQPWFILLVAVFVCTTGFLLSRIVVRDRKLQELDALKTDFLSNVSHELRTPMTSIKGYVDNMLDGIAGDLNERQDRYLTRIKSNADRLTRLINDLLDISRLDRGRTELLQLHIETVPAREIISEAVEALRPMAESAGLTLTFQAEDVTVRADRDRLVQVVTNLVGNAVKFTESGGEIGVTVKPDGTGNVQTVVRDTGRGIPAEDLEQIFDRFYQARGDGNRQPGTGLGLPITKELVELQGGRIRVESEVGVGSTFTFTLPETKE